MEDNGMITLYKDALYWHFINKGYSEWRARIEADRVISLSIKQNEEL
ncbi:MAG: hypothetical protein QXS02_03035 [Candidatus Thermoplasmatota archaeon]